MKLDFGCRTLLGKGQEVWHANEHSITNLLLCTTLARGSFEQLMLWGFVVNTDLTITTEKLVELFAAMDDVFVQILIPCLPARSTRV